MDNDRAMITLRISKDLHQRIKSKAHRAGTSMNEYLVRLLTELHPKVEESVWSRSLTERERVTNAQACTH